jgi:hypothetical protein
MKRLLSLAVFVFGAVPVPSMAKGPAEPSVPARAAVAVAFRDFFESGTSELKPTARFLALNSRRVRLTGFMAQMEEPPEGGFYLCPRPLFADEAGGGTADLPPETVFVVVRSAHGKQIAFLPGPLDVTGTLTIHDLEDGDGQASPIRLILDGPADDVAVAPERAGGPGK